MNHYAVVFYYAHHIYCAVNHSFCWKRFAYKTQEMESRRKGRAIVKPNAIVKSLRVVDLQTSGKEKKTHEHKQISGIVPGLGGWPNFVYVFFFVGSPLMGEKNTYTKSPPKSRDNPVKFWFTCFLFGERLRATRLGVTKRKIFLREGLREGLRKLQKTSERSPFVT